MMDEATRNQVTKQMKGVKGRGIKDLVEQAIKRKIE